MYNGSQWRKWDLHVHTPDSYENQYSFSDENERKQYSGDLWEKYICELEKIEDISVIGITDYFTIEGYKKILEYREKGRLKNFDLILPNIELRLDVLSGKDNKRLNFHIIFSDEIRPEIIEEDFLHSLEFQTGNSEIHRLTKQNIEDLGRSLKEENKGLNDSNFQEGCKKVVLNMENILKVLKGNISKFNGKYLLVLSAREWDEIGWNGQGHIIKKNSLFKSHAVFSSSPKTIAFCQGKTHISIREFEKEFGQIKPCIHGSDAHSFDRLCMPDEERFCWIKAEPSFDGLKQIIYEPASRVKIQKENPELYKNIYTIRSVEFYDSNIDEKISLIPKIIPLNKNFVAITGGKGSGKTAILDLIANCYLDRCYHTKDDKKIGEDKNSFVQRIQMIGDQLGVKLEFIDPSIEPFQKKLTEDSFFEKSSILYLPQGKIDEISGDKDQLNDKIKEIIFNDPHVKEERYLEKFSALEVETKRISHNLYEINSKIVELEQDTSDLVISAITKDKQITEGKLADIKNQIHLKEATLEKGIQDQIASLKKEIKSLKDQETNCQDIQNSFELLKGGIAHFAFTSNNSIESINKKIKSLNINSDEKDPLHIEEFEVFDFSDQLSSLNIICQKIQQKQMQLASVRSSKESQLKELMGEEKSHSKLLKEVDSLENEIKKTNEKLKGIESNKEVLSQIIAQRETAYNSLLESFRNWKKYYDEVIQTFSIGKNEILGDINFSSRISIDIQEFQTVAKNLINKKKLSEEEIEAKVREYSTILKEYFNGNSNFDQIKRGYNKFLALPIPIKRSTSNQHYYNWLFGNYFNLMTDIHFGDTPLENLSMGQKGTVLLKLFLAEGDYPIILDQPEENLDNKFIYKELVGAMRDAKNNRQVIIATNNANLVVNTDADQIIIAEFKGGKISYKSGGLESPEIRQEIMPLLEGGLEAFKKREQKYGILGYHI